MLLKDLFTASVSKEEAAAADDVKDRIRALIEGEDRRDTLSDSRLEKLLAEEEIMVSRRTIAKYREQMGIPDSNMRAYL